MKSYKRRYFQFNFKSIQTLIVHFGPAPMSTVADPPPPPTPPLFGPPPNKHCSIDYKIKLIGMLAKKDKGAKIQLKMLLSRREEDRQHQKYHLGRGQRRNGLVLRGRSRGPRN